jgi:hypothetical protein
MGHISEWFAGGDRPAVQAMAERPELAALTESRSQRFWRLSHRWVWWTVLIIGVLCGIATIVRATRLMITFHTSQIQEVDSQGYFLMAKSFSEGRWPRWADDIGMFRGHVWVDTVDGQVAAKYSPGAPLLLAIGYKLNGYDGAMWTNTVLAVIGLIAFFLLAWDLFDPAIAAICTFIWAFCPALLYYSQYPLGHGAELCIIPLAMMFTVRWGRTGLVAFAIAAGLCVGFMPLVRPTTALIWPAAAIAYFACGGWARWMAWREGLPEDEPSWRRGLRVLWRNRDVFAFVIALAIPLAWAAVYDRTLFGKAWWTGYHLTGEDAAFDWTDMRKHVTTVLQIRGFLLEDGIWLLCVLGLFLRFRRNGLGWMLAIWAVPSLLLYLGYYFFPPSTAFMRFLMPSTMAMVLCIGLPFRSKPASWQAVSLLALIGFAVWMWESPPRILVLTEPNHAPVRADESSRAIEAFMNAKGTPSPYIKYVDPHHVTDFYGSTEREVWDLSGRPRINGYQLQGWWDNHFFRANSPSCLSTSMNGIKYDVRRHERLHNLYKELATAGVRAAFVEHVGRNLDAGHDVLIEAKDNQPIQQLKKSGRFQVELAGPDTHDVWRITKKPIVAPAVPPATAPTSAPATVPAVP